ncbi:hypothetical protein CASFOL_010011 [Castilleja foliolosa]|uniref:Uncharacterized protein n=1 Tax=Castilleja foliolosa TaxID=1961234 RepID=A0ABD3DVH1_9LAMI
MMFKLLFLLFRRAWPSSPAGSWRLLAPGSAAESAPHDGGLVSFFRRVFSAPAKSRDPAVCGGSRPHPATLTLSDGCGSELRQLM